jgi:hypothetical protein
LGGGYVLVVQHGRSRGGGCRRTGLRGCQHGAKQERDGEYRENPEEIAACLHVVFPLTLDSGSEAVLCRQRLRGLLVNRCQNNQRLAKTAMLCLFSEVVGGEACHSAAPQTARCSLEGNVRVEGDWLATVFPRIPIRWSGDLRDGSARAVCTDA